MFEIWNSGRYISQFTENIFPCVRIIRSAKLTHCDCSCFVGHFNSCPLCATLFMGLVMI